MGTRSAHEHRGYYHYTIGTGSSEKIIKPIQRRETSKCRSCLNRRGITSAWRGTNAIFVFRRTGAANASFFTWNAPGGKPLSGTMTAGSAPKEALLHHTNTISVPSTWEDIN